LTPAFMLLVHLVIGDHQSKLSNGFLLILELAVVYAMIITYDLRNYI
jgi:hypothetical protein